MRERRIELFFYSFFSLSLFISRISPYHLAIYFSDICHYHQLSLYSRCYCYNARCSLVRRWCFCCVAFAVCLVFSSFPHKTPCKRAFPFCLCLPFGAPPLHLLAGIAHSSPLQSIAAHCKNPLQEPTSQNPVGPPNPPRSLAVFCFCTANETLSLFSEWLLLPGSGEKYARPNGGRSALSSVASPVASPVAPM